jgi:hypothetical protein
MTDLTMAEAILATTGLTEAGVTPRLLGFAAIAIVGVLFGLIAERTRFCLFGGVSEARSGAGDTRLRAFFVATFVGIAATQGLTLATGVDLSASVPLAAAPSLAALVIGGVLFGLGAALANGCVGRLTVLAPGGNLRAMVVLVVAGVTAYATMRGVLAPARLAAADLGGIRLDPAALPKAGAALGLSPLLFGALAIVSALLVVLWIARPANGRRLFAGAALVGLLVAGGWAATGLLGADPFDPLQPISLSFVAPVALTLNYAMPGSAAAFDAGIALFAGVLSGAAVSTALAGRFVLRGYESLGHAARGVTGGVLMGFGGVLAGGCTAGNGLTALSTLSIGAPVALVAIIGGMLVGIRLLQRPTATLVGAAVPAR